MTQTDIRVLDLFAGAGGLTAGFHEASDRFRSIAAVELDSAAAASYEATFGPEIVRNTSISDWLRTSDVPDSVDVVVGGPPCQGFSTLGKQDAEDVRNSLWRQYAETLTRVKPKYFVVENVAAFGKSAQYEQFVEATQGEGFLKDYKFEFQVLNSADFGAAQTRKRAFLLGHHRDLPAPRFPTPTHARNPKGDQLPWVPVSDVLEAIPRSPDSDVIFTQKRTEYLGKTFPGEFIPREMHWNRQYSEVSMQRFMAIPPGGNRFDIPEHLLAACWKAHKSGSADVMGRLHWDRPAVTIRTEFFKPEKGRYLHPTANRSISHYEAAAIQGFPDTHKFVGSRTSIARQIGNAVPIALGAAVARSIADVYN